MVSQISINVKLQKLKEYSGYLKGYLKYSFVQIEKDHTLQGALLHYLQLAIESMLDVGEIIISELRAVRPDQSREIFLVLAKHKVLPKKFALHVAPMAGFRNLLVHEYARVDLEKVYDNLKINVEDFDRFVKHIAQYLRK